MIIAIMKSRESKREQHTILSMHMIKNDHTSTHNKFLIFSYMHGKDTEY